MYARCGGGTCQGVCGLGRLPDLPGIAGDRRGQRAAAEGIGHPAGDGRATLSGRWPPGISSGGASIGVVQATQDRAGDDVAGVVPSRPLWLARHRHALAAPLVRAGLIEVGDILTERPT